MTATPKPGEVEQMSKDLAEQRQKEALVVPLLGLVVSPESTNEVAEALGSIREAKRLLDEARGELERLLADEAQRQGTKTLHTDKLTVSVSGGPETVYDMEVLEQLQEAGLPEERYNELIKTEVIYRVDRNVVRQLRGSGNPDYEAIIEKAASVVERPYRVSVKRA
jgi:hypothetical protein